MKPEFPVLAHRFAVAQDSRTGGLDERARSAVAELRCVRDLLLWAAGEFQRYGLWFGHGTDNAFDEAAYLAAYALQIEPVIPDVYLGARLTTAQRQAVMDNFVERISSRRPAAYVVGEAWFAGMPFAVDERVLVPRSPLAEWIDREFQPFVDPDQTRRILDLCTGSGCIAAALAVAFPEAAVDAVDISAAALELAAENLDRLQLTGRVRLRQADLFTGNDERYDLIISNPPYVDDESLARMPPEYHREPNLGLTAGVDGLDVVRRILTGAADHLSEHGVLVVEVGDGRQRVEQTWPDLAPTWLDFEHGGEGVFLVARGDLMRIEELRGKAL